MPTCILTPAQPTGIIESEVRNAKFTEVAQLPQETVCDKEIFELERLVRLVNMVIKKRGRDILVDFDITPPQFNALVALDDHGVLTMGELCDHLYLACSTATDLIDRMERNGLIERQRDQNDRRVIRLKITERGQNIIDQVMDARRRYLANTLAGLDREATSKIVHSLDQLYSLMVK